MENIIRHIEKLLASNDHVVVPGLGAFIIQHAPASIQRGFIIPPSATISFNPLICDTDGALALEISRSLKVSYKEASDMIREFVARLRTTLQSDDFSFGQLGTFLSGNTNTPEFVPAERPTFLPQNFAFTTINTNTGENQNQKIKKQSRTRWIQYAAVFLALISLFIPGTVNQNQHISRADLSLIKTIMLDEITVTPAITVQDEIAETKVTRSTIYKVVVAVYQSKEKANELSGELSQKYPDAEILQGTNDFRVVIGTFDSLSSAVNYMEQVRHLDSRFPDAWVMTSF